MSRVVKKNDNLDLLVQKNGVVDLGQAVSELNCEVVTKFIDGFDDREAEINYGGSETRIWSAQEYCSAVKEFAAFSDEIVSLARGKSTKCFTVLAYKNEPCDLKAYSLGRWHIDSFRTQLKVFSFLRPVGEENGPLEILIKTHQPMFKALGIGAGAYISPNDVFRNDGFRKYSRISERYTGMLGKLGVKKKRMTTSVPGESFLVDSSAIHRASPLVSGNRYALCAYYSH
jgi:hypothetical protein